MQIKITINGKPASGKTHLRLALEKFFEEYNFKEDSTIDFEESIEAVKYTMLKNSVHTKLSKKAEEA